MNKQEEKWYAPAKILIECDWCGQKFENKLKRCPQCHNVNKDHHDWGKFNISTKYSEDGYY